MAAEVLSVCHVGASGANAQVSIYAFSYFSRAFHLAGVSIACLYILI